MNRRAVSLAIGLAAALSLGGTAEARTPTSAGFAEGETFEVAPFSVTIRSEIASRIVDLRIVNSVGEGVDLDTAAYSGPDKAFEVELPILAPHGYRLTWKLRDPRGRESVGSVGFVVRGCSDPRGLQPPPAADKPAS